MPVVLISDDECLVHEVEESRFYYQRIPGDVRSRILHEHTLNGVIDFWQFRYHLGLAALTGWDNVCDAHGAPVEFQSDRKRFVPGSIVVDIGIKADDLTPQNFFGPSGVPLNGHSPSKAGPVATVAGS